MILEILDDFKDFYDLNIFGDLGDFRWIWKCSMILDIFLYFWRFNDYGVHLGKTFWGTFGSFECDLGHQGLIWESLHFGSGLGHLWVIWWFLVVPRTQCIPGSMPCSSTLSFTLVQINIACLCHRPTRHLIVNFHCWQLNEISTKIKQARNTKSSGSVNTVYQRDRMFIAYQQLCSVQQQKTPQLI